MPASCAANKEVNVGKRLNIVIISVECPEMRPWLALILALTVLIANITFEVAIDCWKLRDTCTSLFWSHAVYV